MNKPVFGMLLGSGLGFLDGLSALIYPGFLPQIGGILVGSTFKGVVVGLLIGLFAARIKNPRHVVVFGGVVGLFFAFLVAYMNYLDGMAVWVEVMAPGMIMGLITGYLVHGHGKKAVAA